MFKPKIFILLLALLIAAVAFLAAPAPAQTWDYLRPQGSITGAKTTDSAMCYVTNAWDTTCVFYFNGLYQKGGVFLKMVDKVAARDSLFLPRIEYQFLPEPNGTGSNRGKYVGKYGYVPNDSLAYTLYGPGDSSAVVIQKKLTWNKEIAQKAWKVLVDSSCYITWTAGDTCLKVLPYDFTAFKPYAVRFRLGVGGILTQCSTLVKEIHMTGEKPSKFQLQP